MPDRPDHAVSIFAPAVPLNRDAKMRHQYNLRVLEAFRAPQWVWSARETELLQTVLLAQLQEDFFRRRLAVTSVEGNEAKAALLLRLCDEVRSKELHELMEQQGHIVDWMTVAEKLRLAGEGAKPRSACSCLVHYKHFIDRRASQDIFSSEEEASLKSIVASRGSFEWEEIAAELGTRRTGWQCFNQHQTFLVPTSQRGTAQKKKVHTWSKEQETRLRLAQQVYGSHDWSSVARHVPGHTAAECRLKAGPVRLLYRPWSKEEDRRLLSAFKRHGQNWLQVSLKTFGRPRSAMQRRLLRLLKVGSSKSSASVPRSPRLWRSRLFEIVRRGRLKGRKVS